jgi:hypothetical protein
VSADIRGVEGILFAFHLFWQDHQFCASTRCGNFRIAAPIRVRVDRLDLGACGFERDQLQLEQLDQVLLRQAVGQSRLAHDVRDTGLPAHGLQQLALGVGQLKLADQRTGCQA